MAGEVSIAIRAVDMTRAVFGRIRRGLGDIGKQAKGAFAGLGIGGAGGLFGGAAAVFGLSRAIRAATDNARELRGSLDMSPELKRNVDAVNVMSDSIGSMTGRFKNFLTNQMGGFYRAAFRIKAMFGGASWAESGQMADEALTDYGAGDEAAKKLREQMVKIADAKADYAAELKGEAAVLERLAEKQDAINKRIAESAKVSDKRVAAETELLEITKKIDTVKASIAAKEKEAYEAAQERIAKEEEANFEARQPAIQRLRQAAIDPDARRAMRDEIKQAERDQKRFDRVLENADRKTRMAAKPGNANRKRFQLNTREALAMEAGRLNQQDDAMAQSLKNVDENTKKMLEKLTDNLRLK